jgi:hypothetical protein
VQMIPHSASKGTHCETEWRTSGGCCYDSTVQWAAGCWALIHDCPAHLMVEVGFFIA